MYVTFPTRKGKKTLPLCAVTPINKKNTAGQKVTEEFVDNGFMLGALHWGFPGFHSTVGVQLYTRLEAESGPGVNPFFCCPGWQQGEVQ